MIAESNDPGDQAKAGDGMAQKVRVLIVDDDLDHAEALRQLFQLHGFAARTAHCGTDAVDLAEAYRPEIIIMDICMPNMNGWEAARQILALPGCRHCQIIALSGRDDEPARKRSMEAGMALHLVKSLEFAELHRLLLGLGQERRARPHRQRP